VRERVEANVLAQLADASSKTPLSSNILRRHQFRRAAKLSAALHGAV